MRCNVTALANFRSVSQALLQVLQVTQDLTLLHRLAVWCLHV